MPKRALCYALSKGEEAMDTMSEKRDSAKARGERTIEAFTGIAELEGIKDEEDVVALVKEVRSERS